jgi:lipoprotein-anchoring transpeptidase ErfK/SrfK
MQAPRRPAPRLVRARVAERRRICHRCRVVRSQLRGVLFVLSASLAVAACGRSSSGDNRSRNGSADVPSAASARSPVPPGDDSTALARVPTAADSALPPYHLVAIHSAAELTDLQRRVGATHFETILRLNRIDRAHARDRDTLVVPRTTAWDSLSPFPSSLPEAQALPKLLLVSAAVQAYAAYDSGRRVRWGPTSTGRRESPTPPGLYHTNWKQPERRSSVNEEWLLRWYVNLDSRRGISLHLFELPGYPASHSCVRLLEDDARWLYDWADTWSLDPRDRRHVARDGTPVLVLGEYPFGARRPWRQLGLDPHATDVRGDTIVAALRAHVLPASPPLAAPIDPAVRPDTAR